MSKFDLWQHGYDSCPTPEAYQNAKAAWIAAEQEGYIRGMLKARGGDSEK